MSAIKPYTKYRCSASCGSTRWTGAMRPPHQPNNDLCPCGSPWVEVVEDGHTYRVSWEAIGPHGDGWHPTHRDTTDRADAVDQWRTLLEWERTGQEAVRSVLLTRSVTSFEPWSPDAEDGAS